MTDKSIYISESTEKDMETGFEGRVLWLNFKTCDGKSAMANINNIADQKSGVVGMAMCQAIREYNTEYAKHHMKGQQVYDALGLLADKMDDEMSSLSSSTKEWCDLAEKYIAIVREMLAMEDK